MYILTSVCGLQRYAVGYGADIWRSPDAGQSWDAAVALVDAKRRVAQEAQLNARLSLLAERGYLRTPDLLSPEGESIYAVKTTGGLRAYGWFSQLEGKKAFVISHVVLKKRQKLDPVDLRKAVRCRDLVNEALKASNSNGKQGVSTWAR